jgi:AraC-like DNA-binding protein
LAYLVNMPRLSVVLAGRDLVEIEEDNAPRLLNVKRGEALFVPANCWDRPTWSSRVTVVTFLFGKRQTGVSLVRCDGRPDADAMHAMKAHFPRSVDGPLPGILDALTQLDGKFPPRLASLLVESILNCCIALLRDADAAARPHGKGDKVFHNICLYMQLNFHFPLTRDSVAEHFRLSPNHVSRLFRRHGLTRFVDYLTWVRLDRAKYLLRHHNLTVDEVARACGFADTGYFCRTFKRKLKLTPTAYRLARS